MGLTKGKGQTLVQDDAKSLLGFVESATTQQEASSSKRLEKSREAQKRHKAPKEASALKNGKGGSAAPKQLSALDRAKLQVKGQAQRKKNKNKTQDVVKSTQANATETDNAPPQAKPKTARRVAFA